MIINFVISWLTLTVHGLRTAFAKQVRPMSHWSNDLQRLRKIKLLYDFNGIIHLFIETGETDLPAQYGMGPSRHSCPGSQSSGVTLHTWPGGHVSLCAIQTQKMQRMHEYSLYNTRRIINHLSYLQLTKPIPCYAKRRITARLVTSLPSPVRSAAVSLYVCLFVSALAYLQNHMPRLREIFVNVTRGRGSVPV